MARRWEAERARKTAGQGLRVADSVTTPNWFSDVRASPRSNGREVLLNHCPVQPKALARNVRLCHLLQLPEYALQPHTKQARCK